MKMHKMVDILSVKRELKYSRYSLREYFKGTAEAQPPPPALASKNHLFHAFPMEDGTEHDDVENSEDHMDPERCIDNCSLFIPDNEFDKAELVRMWITKGCIGLGAPIKIMECVGCLYFELLVDKKVIVASRFDHESIETMYKFNSFDEISPEDERAFDDLEKSKDHMVPERCIDHCRLFIPEYEFYKAKLIRMWIAEGCIELGAATKRMEDVGCLYFDSLVDKEVIVASRFDGRAREIMYKFNSSRASDGLLKQEGAYVSINASNLREIKIDKKALHLTWLCQRIDRTLCDALKNFCQLHTLIVHPYSPFSINELPDDIFLGLGLLRTLDLSHTSIEKLPFTIHHLKSLLYLDISWTRIKMLPSSLDCLHCLQTLNLKACYELYALPKGLGKLVNLRHLDLDIAGQLRSMPKGMGNLTKLQTLLAFIVEKSDGCSIRELKNMNEITGSFWITRLENVSDAEDAKEAAIFDKKYIDKLVLRWRAFVNEDTLEILEYLQPHFHLKELWVTYYSGSRLPSWISYPSYTDLASIYLDECMNCNIIPTLGELPSLKNLHILRMDKVRKIDTWFCRNYETKIPHAFPRLEELTLNDMVALEEWTGVEDGDFPCLRRISINSAPKLHLLPSLSHFCSLERLELVDCMELISLPSLPVLLESLRISGDCSKLKERCLNDRSEIASVRSVWIDHEEI